MNYSVEVKSKNVFCPKCGELLDGATSIGNEEHAKPVDGAISICVYCGNISKFKGDEENMVLVSMTQEELDEFKEKYPEDYNLIVKAVNEIRKARNVTALFGL